MLNFDRQPGARRQTGLEQKQTEYTRELADIEAKIGRVEQLQTMVDGLSASQNVLAMFEASEPAAEKIAAAIDAVRDLEVQQNLASLLDRRRQLKQLLETGKLDLGITPDTSL